MIDNMNRLKEKSDIYSRFSDCKLDFILTRESGPTIEGKDSALLAKSDNFNLLDDSNSIVVETESLMGTWQNRYVCNFTFSYYVIYAGATFSSHHD